MKKVRTLRRRLFFDIETAPNIGVFFSAGYKLNIGYQSIIKERAIICICYKWEGDKEVTSLEWDNNQCDKKMLEKFIQVANTADEMVGHNGLKFDLNWIRTRCLLHKIDMFPNYTVIDTLTIARAKFKFNSNKLDYIAKFLGIGKKIKTDFDLWKNILLNKDKIAMAKMVKYCKGDVILLQKVYDRLKNHIIVKSHFGKVFKQDRGSCPECGGDEIVIKTTRYTSAGSKRVQYQCNICHKYHTKTEK